ncbi:MAG: methyltransferase domain-containing protein [Elusimicrobia bacterium]|nr:methyltransferase domain-containing protein [Elusimicrobiota bacterium]
MSGDRLSERGHWDALFKGVELPRKLDFSQHHYRACAEFMRPFLEQKRGGALLEAGCGASAWLPYFAGTCGMRVSGLDYSPSGCELAKKNLELQGMAAEAVYCADVFEFSPPHAYDVVFSYGVIEHFTDYRRLLSRMAGWLAPGGVLLTLVPNMGGASGWLNRLAVPDVFDMHVRLDRAELGSAHSDTGLKLLRCDYAGVFSLAVVPWARSRKAFFLARPVLSLINYSNALLSKVCNVMPEFGTALLSPYIMAAAVRDGK